MVRGISFINPICFICVKCRMSGTLAKNLKKHLFESHKISTGKIQEFFHENTVVTDDYASIEGCTLPCIKCAKNFQNIDELTEHYDDKQDKAEIQVKQPNAYVHWSSEHTHLFYTEPAMSTKFSLEDTEKYETPSPIKNSHALGKLHDKQRALNHLTLPMNPRSALEEEASKVTSFIPKELKETLQVNDADYSQLIKPIDDSSIYIAGIGESGLDELVKEHATLLTESILINRNMAVCVFAWDAFVTAPVAGDECAHKREPEYTAQDTAHAVFLRKQDYQGGSFYYNLEIRWGCLTFVAIGTLLFNKQELECQMVPKLGSSMTKEMANLSKLPLKIYVRKDVAVYTGLRLLRDYAKPSAALKWSFISKTLTKKGLIPSHPTQLWTLYAGEGWTPIKATAISLIIDIYITGSCSLRQTTYIYILLSSKLDISPVLRGVLKKLQNSEGEDKTTIRSTISKLNVLNQYTDAGVYNATMKENSRLIKNFKHQ